ncbi:MAG: hypothetical protein KJO13_06380, partial [Gammaproteobacteria bacterium]|nr:hypothetical protein [Gammaproteobacteria bacterium]
MTTNDVIQTFGHTIEGRLISELPVTPVERYEHMLDLQNLKGDSTGYIKVYSGGRLEKGSSLSIDIAPGIRYFNIHIIPNAQYRAPRYIFEGMVSTHGSQVSMDLFPDIDKEMDVDWLIRDFGGVTEIYDAALADDRYKFRSSRYMHMRAFQSPFFLCAHNVAEADMPPLEDYANRYFDEWLKLLASASKVSDVD